MSGNVNLRRLPYVVKRREFIQDVVGSVAFSVASFPDNPGLPNIYPWLNTMAPLYEEYKCVSKRFLYETESATTATGAVILAYDYDALDSAPADKQSALTIADNVRTAPWARADLNLRPADLSRRGSLYTRTGTVSGSDLKTYDQGQFHLCTSGQADTSVVGELWVEYTFHFFIPQPVGPPPSAKVVAGGTVSRAAFYGSASTVTGLLGVSASASTLTFPHPGQYAISHFFTGGTLTTTAPTWSGTVPTASTVIGVPDGAATSSVFITNVTVTAANQTLIGDATASGATITASTTRISCYQTSLV